MAQFDSKIFNAEVFASYVERIPRVKQNQLLQNGILKQRNDFKAMFDAQAGGNYITIPMFGLIDGQALNYDGTTDITATSTKTYSRSVVVVGRAKAWTERDFSYDITGEDFMANVANQTSNYWEDVDQDTLLAILKGVYSMSGADNAQFVQAHTHDIAASGEGVVNAITLNNAIQKAAGENKRIFRVVICHSAIATNLENISAVEYLKYTDAGGVQRDLGMATWNGRTLIIDDSLPVTTGYVDATATDAGAIKLVANSATPAAGEMKLNAVSNYKGAKTLAAGDYILETPIYTSYVLGEGAFDYCDVGARVPYEMDRDPAVNGGVDTLYTRQRKVFAPYGISFTKTSMASASPTNAELESGANWTLVNDGAASGATVINHKAIPIARIISRG